MGPFIRHAVPQHAHPIVRRLFELANEHRTSVRSVEDRAGLGRKTMANWLGTNEPKLSNVAAALNALGYELVIRRKPE